MNVLANPTIEGVTVFAKVLGQWIGNHIRIWKPVINEH